MQSTKSSASNEVHAMNIVIIGAGKVGEELTRALAKEGHNVVLIEKDARKLEQLISAADITGVHGNGAIYKTQLEAGVDHCDIFIAVSQSDETNIIAAITARKAGAEKTIARVRDPEFSLQMGFVRESLGISLMINPELEAATDISRILQFPFVLDIEQFMNGRVNIIEVQIPETSRLAGMSLRDLKTDGNHVLVCIIERGDQVIIPGGDTTIMAGDRVHVTGKNQSLTKLFAPNREARQRLSSALIIGGGKLTHYLLPMLLKMRMRIKVIEVEPEIADNLAADFPEAEVICGDGTNQSFLREERMSSYDTVISLTGIDEENLLLSLFAKQQGVPKVITKVNRTDLLKVIDCSNLGSVVTPRRLVADNIIRFVRAMENSQASNVEALYRLADNRVETLLFHVTYDSKALRIPIMDIKLKPGLLIAFIARKGKVIFPSGRDVIMPDDRVAIVTTQQNIRDIDDILSSD
jgi:trk system potassium uptake protein TrkA